MKKKMPTISMSQKLTMFIATPHRGLKKREKNEKKEEDGGFDGSTDILKISADMMRYSQKSLLKRSAMVYRLGIDRYRFISADMNYYRLRF